jgi:outer membrane protein TolC
MKQQQQKGKLKLKLLVVFCLLTAVFFQGISIGNAAQLELTLEDAVKMTLTNNPTGKIAVFDYEAAKGALTAARSSRWPTIAGTHTDSWTMPGDNSNQALGRDPGSVTDRFSNNITASLILWSGNLYESQISQAKLSLDSTQWGIAKARQQLKYDATTAYFNFMASRDAVKLSQESVDRLEQYLKDVRLQFDVGVVAKVDVLRSEVELAKAKQTLIEWQNTYNITMANLNNIVGLPLTTELSIRGDMSYTVFDQSLVSCVEAALRQRPEISQATDAAKLRGKASRSPRPGICPPYRLAIRQAGLTTPLLAATTSTGRRISALILTFLTRA